MATPSYAPMLTPQQQQQFQLAQYLNRVPQQQGPLTYEQWLAQRGGGNPYAQAPQQPKAPGLDLGNIFGGGGSGAAGNAAAGSSAPVASAAAQSGLASSAGANAAYNTAAMEASGAPMTLAEPATAAAAPGAFDLAGIGSAGNAFLPLAGAVGAYDLIKNKRGGARGIGQGAASGAALGSYFGPWGAGAGALLGGAYGALQHESTRDVAKRHTTDLLSKFPDDPTYQAYVRGIREQYNAPPPDPSHPFHGGQYASWDEYQKAGLDAADLTGVKGNLDLGPGFTNLTPDQQKSVTQALINAHLYNSKKGEVEVTDQVKAKQLLDDEIKNGFKTQVIAPGAPAPAIPSRNTGPALTPMVWQNASQAPQASALMMIPRTKTRSPGIGLDGRPINYGR